MGEIVIIESDQGRTFEVRQGDSVSIRLQENPTTGYVWEVDAVDAQVIAFQGSEYTRAPGTGIGGGRMRTLLFKAESRGASVIRLGLRRGWEPEDAAIARFRVDIRVR